MRFISLFFVYIVFNNNLLAQKQPLPATPEKYPQPPFADNRLFFIQRSPNIDIVVYDANVLADKTLNAKNPVHPYWIRYADGGKKSELTAIQRTLAYGVTCHAMVGEAGSYEMNVVSYKKRKFKIMLDAKGVPIALFPINGKLAILHHVFVKIDQEGLLPKIPWVNLYGKDPKTGVDVFEQFKP